MTAALDNRQAIRALTPQFDGGIGPRGRIGFIALANGYVSEHEVASIVPRESLVVYVSRVASDNVINLDNLRAIETDMTRAAGMILPSDRIDVMVYGCTSGTIALGEDRVEERIRAVRPNVAVTTPITGALAAFRALDIKRIVLLTPYILEVTAAMRDYIAGRGIEILDCATFDCALNSDQQRVSPDAIAEAAIALDREDADAIFVCCTALRAAGVIERIESVTKKPVVTSNQALAWHAMRLAGYDEPVLGYGRLLRM
ncbi:MAG: Asp/Glu racemase [Alphaproteobacteria bacterium]